LRDIPFFLLLLPDHLQRGAQALQPEEETEVGLIGMGRRERRDDAAVGGRFAGRETELGGFVDRDKIVARSAVRKVDETDRDAARDLVLLAMMVVMMVRV
jgi:hypothetical protein